MELKEIITEMDQLKEELEALRPIPEDRTNRLKQKLRLDWNYHSNSIEGNTLTASETRAFILHGITAKGKPFRDYIEMEGHNEAIKKLENIVHKDIKITESLIKEIHKMILVKPYDGESEINPGEYKKMPNYLYSLQDERIDFEPPEEVPRLMNELVNWLNNHIDPPKRKKRQYDLHPLLIATGFHAQFIKIHPFGDGNGRMARILTNLILMLCGYVPAIVRQEKRQTYYNALNMSTLDEPEPLAEFIGEECIHSLEVAIKAAKGESIDEPEDIDKKLSLLDQKIKGLDKEEITLEKSKEVTDDLFEQLVLPVVKHTAEKLDRFREHFHEIEFVTTLYGISKSYKDSGEIENDLRKNWLEKKKPINQFKLTCKLKGFKKAGIDTFDINKGLWFKFEKFKYALSYSPHKPKLEYPYHRRFDDREIEEISTSIFDQVFHEINRRLDKKKK
ncbi:MAG: Fic family protein [Bacteroidales bacterium]|nr:Fic family protein [Bacteroidales bacterium]MCF8334710.1 Fic family protein [Bacteroidales bacterium]